MNFEDRTILIFLAIFIITIFLDKQAKKQQKSFIQNSIKKTKISELVPSRENLPIDIHKKAEKIEEKVQETFKEPKKNEFIYKLFYLRLAGKTENTLMYAVNRVFNTKPNPEILLENLRKGPSDNEPNLVNAFFKNIKIEKIQYNPQRKIVHLYFSDNFLSKNQRILKDRIDQICLTLKQLPEILEIYYWVNEEIYYKQSQCNRTYKDYENE